MSVPKSQSTKKTNWRELLPHNEEILIQSFLSFPTHLVTLERSKGLSNFRLIDKNDNSHKFVNFQDQTYETYFAANKLPARTCIGVTGVAVGALIEIDLITKI